MDRIRAGDRDPLSVRLEQEREVPHLASCVFLCHRNWTGEWGGGKYGSKQARLETEANDLTG